LTIITQWQIENISDVLTTNARTFLINLNEAACMSDIHQTESVPSSEPQNLSEHIEVNFDAKRKKLGVEDGLKDIPGVTTPMLVAFAEHGIRSVEDLADCATDDLDGWNEFKDGKVIRHTGILDRFRVSRQDCDAIIINARSKAGWFK
jgi:transcription termination/antitermination protein NusA